MGRKISFLGKLRSSTDVDVEITIVAIRREPRSVLEAGYQFQVQQAGGEAIGQGVGRVGKVFDQ